MKKRAGKRDGVYQRNGSYWISWTDASGRRRRERTHAVTAKQAKLYRDAKLNRIEQAFVLGFTPPTEETFEQVAEKFLRYQKGRLTPAAYEREQGIVNQHLIPAFPLKIADVRRVEIQRYLLNRTGKVSADSIIKEFNTLKHILRLALEWECIPANPAQGIRPPKAAPGRVRYLQPNELKAVIMQCTDWLRSIVVVAVNTGMRRSEILKLRPLDIDLHHGRILLRQTKNGESRIVYLNAAARAVLAAAGTGAAGTEVFSSYTPEQVSVAFARAAKRAGVLDFRFHDLRHTAASWLRMQGADIHTVAQILGHKDLRMAARYQHLSPAFMAEAVGRLDAAFGLERHLSVTEQKMLNAGMSATA
jgi:integrase